MSKDTLSNTMHEQVWALLPWYINQTLSGEELARVTPHLKVCIPCRTELAEQQGLQAQMQSATTEALCESVQFSDLMQRIHTRSSDVRSAKRRLWARPWGQIAALAAMLVAVASAPLTSMMTPATTTYYTLTAGSGAAQSQLAGDIRVIFHTHLTDDGRTSLLTEVGAHVVQPADARGVYVIQVGAGMRPAPVLHALAQLRDDPRVVFAEPIIHDRAAAGS